MEFQMTPTKVGVGIVVALATMIGLGFAADTVALPGTSYSMVLPGTPDCATETLSIPGVVEVPASCTVILDGLEYTFDYMLLPIEVPNDQAEGAMFGAAMGHAVGMGGELADKRVGTVDGFPSMDFVIKTENSEIIGYSRLVIVGSHLVRVSIDTAGGRMTKKSAKKIFKSLTID